MKRKLICAALLFAMLLAACCALAESNVYGKTTTTVRVRSAPSVNAELVDNVTSGACVYVLNTQKSGNYRFGEIKYRDYNGKLATGWVCIVNGAHHYVDILSDGEARSFFRVSGGNLPSARVGTFAEKGAVVAASTSSAAAAKATPKPEAGQTNVSAVKQLQTNLKTLGYYNGSITGNVGPKTIDAIKAFQKAQGMKATGSADAATIKAAAEAVAKKDSAPKATAAPKTTTAQIKRLQENLKALGYYSGSITGNIGDKTAAAIKAFQKKRGLQATGQADSATIAAAEEAAKAKNGGSSSAETATPSEIKKVQQNLTKLGYYSGVISGNLGSKTQTAIKNFQKKNGLTATGQPDAKTRQAIQKAVEKKAESASSGSKGVVYNVDWFAHKADFYNKIGVKRGGTAKLTDLLTGKSLNLHIQSTGNHADCEPMTAADTKTLCEIYGVTKAENISYVRRPMLLTAGGYQMVCSIYGTPHGEQDITNNQYPGQLCLHFRGSETHGSARVDEDHQNAIQKAISIMEGKGKKVVEKAPEL